MFHEHCLEVSTGTTELKEQIDVALVSSSTVLRNLLYRQYIFFASVLIVERIAHVHVVLILLCQQHAGHRRRKNFYDQIT